MAQDIDARGITRRSFRALGLLLVPTFSAALLITACDSATSSDAPNSPTSSSPTSSPAQSASPETVQSSTPTPSPPQSTGPSRGPNPDVSAEQQALLDNLLATPLPVDEVQQRIKAAGYTSRIVEIDGEPQPATMDYRIDRVNLITSKGLVTDAYWG